MRFCGRCGAELTTRVIEGKERSVCPRCGQVWYRDPKVAACTVPLIRGGVVLIRRAISPGKGLWVFPGGYMDAGETVEEAAVRETREECNLEVRCTGLLGLYSYRGAPVVIAVYRAEVIDGELRPGPESSEAATFTPDRVPWRELAFPSTADALADLFGRPRPTGADRPAYPPMEHQHGG